MSESPRFCIRSVSPDQRRRLESLDPPPEPRDCLGVCTICFDRPVIVRAGALLDEPATRALLADHPRPLPVEDRDG